MTYAISEGVLCRRRRIVCWKVTRRRERPGRSVRADITGMEQCLGWSQYSRTRQTISRRGRMTRLEWGQRGRRRSASWSEREKEQTRVDLPETASTDKHIGPTARVSCLHSLKPDGRVLARNQTHTFKLLQQVSTLENPFSPDIHTPLALRSSIKRCRARGSSFHMQVRLGLVEVPPQSRPKHHRNLTRWRHHRFIIAGRRIDNIGDIEAVAVQGGGCEAGDIIAVAATGGRPSISRASSSSFFGRRLSRGFFTVDDDCPAWWEGRA